MRFLSILISMLILPAGLGPQDDQSELRGPYLGQQPPGMTPVKFAPELLANTFCSVFSPDFKEFYCAAYNPDPEAAECSIVRFRNVDGAWVGPELCSFSSDFIEHDMSLSPDGRRIVFRSNRPLPGDSEAREQFYHWCCDRDGEEWGVARPVSYGGRLDIAAGYPALTQDGTLYFASIHLEAVGPSDIHYVKPEGEGYSAPVNLGRDANSDYGEGDLFVAPDGSYLIVACWQHPGNNGDQDLYISFSKGDGTWTKPANMGPPVNSEYGENCPQVSPDGKFLFFNRYATEGLDQAGQGTHWVDAGIIESYRSDD